MCKAQTLPSPLKKDSFETTDKLWPQSFLAPQANSFPTAGQDQTRC